MGVEQGVEQGVMGKWVNNCRVQVREGLVSGGWGM